MSVEALVSLGAAWMARSLALLGFGGDSAVELLSAAALLRRFYLPSHEARAEERVAKIAGGLLFVLAAFVVLASVLTLLGHVEARPSPVEIALLILAAVVMPWLAKQKRQLSAATSSAALRADATESAVCGYLALIALVGLVINAIWKVGWADPVSRRTTALRLLELSQSHRSEHDRKVQEGRSPISLQELARYRPAPLDGEKGPHALWTGGT